MSNVQAFTSWSCKVDSYDTLQAIQDNFPCFTREGDPELIVDVGVLKDTDQYDALLYVLHGSGVSTSGLPSSDGNSTGNIHFWK